MTKNRTPTPVYLDPAMHPGLEVKGLTLLAQVLIILVFYVFALAHYISAFKNVKDKTLDQPARFEKSLPPFCQI